MQVQYFLALQLILEKKEKEKEKDAKTFSGA